MSLIFILKAYKENNPPTKQNIDWWGGDNARNSSN